MHRLLIGGIAVLTALSAQAPSAQTPKPRGDHWEVRHLLPQGRFEGQLSTGESHRYRLTLHAGDYLHVTIAQRGIDIVATLIRPDGRDLLTVDACDDDFREEAVVAIVDADGLYTLVVRPVASTTPRGHYTIQLDDLRAATESDRERVEAERAFEHGRGLEMADRPPEFPKAIAELQSAVARYQRHNDRPGQMKALIEIAYMQYRLVQPEALESAQTAEQIAREFGDEPGTAAALHEKALAYWRRGDLAAAFRAAEESTTISRTLGNRKALATALNVEGILHGVTNNPEQTIVRFEEALPLARATGARLAEAMILGNLGNAYDDLGEFAKAFGAYRQSLAQQRALGFLEPQIVDLNNMGLLQHKLKDDRKALELHLKALALSHKTGGKENEARSLNTIGQTYYALGEYTKALDYHRQSLAIRREIGDLVGQGSSLNGAGKAWHRLGDDDSALTALHEALTIRRNIHQQLHERETLHDLAVVERDRGNLGDAIDHAKAALDLDEALRARITSPPLRTSFVAMEQDKYELLIDLLQQQHRADATSPYAAEALHISERARARVLLESLIDARVDLREGIEPALLEHERTVQKRLNDASAQLSRSLAGAKPSAEQRQAAADKVEQLTRDYQRLQADIWRRSPRYAAVTQPQPLHATEIQQSVLDQNTVLLEFAIGEERSWLWAVTPQTITSIELPPRRALDTAARALTERFTARQRRPGESAEKYVKRVSTAEARLARGAAAMSRMLFGGIAKALHEEWRGKRLAIVATGALEYLPFAALSVPEAEAGESSGRVQGVAARPMKPASLIAQHEIVMLPSASVLAVLRRDKAARPTAARTVAILADPVFEKTDPRVQVKPVVASRGTAVAESAHSRLVHLRAGLARLPFSRQEARAIASLLGPGEAFIATDFLANRTTALEGTLADYRFVHFATHGILDTERPSLSGLVLSLVDEHGAPRDGYVLFNDIYNLHLNAELIVLSACQTALGKEIRGEGLVGLARAFMYAGAPRVMASLWEVNDLATAELMKRFYRGMLQGGLQPAAALRAAQLELAQDPRWASPYYWAGFTLQGDWK